jgi:aspartate racemase
MRKLGLVCGLGIGAGIHYYRHIADAFAARGAQPGLVISHADIGRAYTLVQLGAMEELADYLNEHLETLARAGCDFAAIAAVTPLICAPELDRISALPRIDVFDSVNAELKRRGAKRVAVLGTQFVMETDMFGRLDGVEIVRPTPAQAALVRDNYLIIARMGGIENADIEGVRAVGKSLADAGADTVILAGTELSLAFTEANAGFPALDSGRVHIDAIVAHALEG